VLGVILAHARRYGGAWALQTHHPSVRVRGGCGGVIVHPGSRHAATPSRTRGVAHRHPQGGAQALNIFCAAFLWAPHVVDSTLWRDCLPAHHPHFLIAPVYAAAAQFLR